jgi:hypothetical protein
MKEDKGGKQQFLYKMGLCDFQGVENVCCSVVKQMWSDNW